MTFGTELIENSSDFFGSVIAEVKVAIEAGFPNEISKPETN